jgi:hypothetical protein
MIYVIVTYAALVYWIACAVLLGFDMSFWWRSDNARRKHNGQKIGNPVIYSLAFIALIALSPAFVLAFAKIHSDDTR